MKNAQHLHADGDNAVLEEVARRFHPVACNALAAAGEMVDINFFGKLVSVFCARPERIIAEVNQRLTIKAS